MRFLAFSIFFLSKYNLTFAVVNPYTLLNGTGQSIHSLRKSPRTETTTYVVGFNEGIPFLFQRVPKISIEEPETDTLVRFSTVTIREYPITAGDNPSTTRGVPLTVEWNHDQEYTLQVNDFEDVRPSIRRSVGELQTHSLDRLRILKAMGWSGAELKEHMDAVDRIRAQRLQTRHRVQHLAWLERLQENWEKIQRGLGNATIHRRYKQWERQWLEQHR